MVTPVANVEPEQVFDKDGVRINKLDRQYIEEGEHLVTVVHRHPIGIVLIYLGALATVLAILAMVFTLLPSLFDNVSGQAYSLLIALALLGVGILALVLFVATYIYRQSKLLVTDKSLVQILQKGLFVRKVSRLSMSNVEDVTAEHRGILSTMFDYGILTIQTAGEMENFIFTWCPSPDKYADRIIEARQAYAQRIEEGVE
jgi:hypothetical protein